VPLDLKRTTQENAAIRPELHFVVTGGKKSFESVGMEAVGPTLETRRRGVNAGWQPMSVLVFNLKLAGGLTKRVRICSSVRYQHAAVTPRANNHALVEATALEALPRRLLLLAPLLPQRFFS
jgi:hypothetical protein